MRFARIFFAWFIPLILLITYLGGSGEQFVYAVFATLFYAVFGGIVWVATDRFVGTDTLVKSISSILLGLVTMNLLTYFFGGKELLTPAMFGTHKIPGAFRTSLVVHIVFVLSFLAARADKRRNGSCSKDQL